MANRPVMTKAEKLAESVVGIDSEAIAYNMKSENAISGELHKDEVDRFNDAISDIQDRFQKEVDTLQAEGLKIAENLEGLEIMPLGSYALITPYKTNPFQKIRRNESGLITDIGGLSPMYKSNETGKFEEQEQYVHVGMVAEVGADCRFLRPGDIVFYNVNSEVTVPFFKFGFVVVAEQRIIAVVNQKLSERKVELSNKEG